jgi:hypothetical protein
VSANLEQQPEGGDGTHHPVAIKFAVEALKVSSAARAERAYQLHLRELLAVVNTLQAFRQYLLPGCWTVCSTFTRTE